MGHQKRKKDTTAPITKKEKERSRKSIPAIKSSRRSTKRKRKASTKQQHERQRKIKRKSKGKDACYKCGQQGHIIAELQCTTLATMSINSGRILQRMTGIKTRINTKIKDGTTRIGYIEDMIKNQGYQQPATLSSHHQQHRQEWHNPSVQWKTPTQQQPPATNDRQCCSNPSLSTMVWNIASSTPRASFCGKCGLCVCACLAGLLWALQLSNLHSQQTSHLSQGFACCVCTSNSAAKELRKSKRSCFFR